MAKAPSRFSGGFGKKKPDGASSSGATNGGGGKLFNKGKQPKEPKPKAPIGSRKKLGQVFVDLGFITDEQLWNLVEEHRQASEPIGQTAVRMNLISREMLVQALAEQMGLKTVDVNEFVIPEPLLKLMDRNMAVLYKALPVKLEDNVLTVAISDPANLGAMDDLRNFLSVDDVVPVVAGEEEILATIEANYQGSSAGSSYADILGEVAEDEDLQAAGRSGAIDLDDLQEMADAAPVRKLLNMVILTAISQKASDIHLEPFEDEFKIRYRADGVMFEMMPPPRYLAAAIASRVKVMANLDIAERRVPQDGRIELTIGGNPVDLRVSVLPTMFGEGIVMRILDRSVVSLDLNKIGMPTKILSPFREMIKKPHGIFLVTGPTGSGKTTTLYSALSELNTIDTKIITTEDPIEYDIDGIVQVPINSEIGVTFASCLRAILRQDPDIILVGEIRDFETAQISVQSSLTGHMVFSTLHTNDAPGAITRLRDMGVPPFLITATVEGVLAQRLVRKICSKCKTEYPPSDSELMELRLRRDKLQGRNFFQGKGCDTCNKTGYKGRTGIYELLIMNDEIRELINQGGTKDKIMQAGLRAGMMSLRQAGLRAILEGASTVEEVIRETFSDEDF